MDRFCTATDGFAVPTRAARNRQATPRFKRQIPSPRSAVESNRAATPCGPPGPAGAKRLDRMNVRGHQLSTRSPWLRRPLQRNGSHNPYDVAIGRLVSICVALLSPVQEWDQEHAHHHGPGKQIELEAQTVWGWILSGIMAVPRRTHPCPCRHGSASSSGSFGGWSHSLGTARPSRLPCPLPADRGHCSRNHSSACRAPCAAKFQDFVEDQTEASCMRRSGSFLIAIAGLHEAYRGADDQFAAAGLLMRAESERCRNRSSS
jgi:hypothetical protein